MPGRNVREGLAFIGADAASPQTYAAGALLANGAELTEIHRDHVVLTRQGESVELYLQGAASPPDVGGLSALLQVGGAPAAAPLPSPSQDLLTDYLRPSPVFEGESIKGYRVHPGKHKGAFAQLGLKDGDVITAINDAPFASTAEAVELLSQLIAGLAVVAMVEREGKR